MLAILLHALCLVVLFVLAGALGFLGIQLHMRWKYRHLPSPKRQRRNLLLGALKDMADVERNGGHISQLFLEWSKECGTVFVVFLVRRAAIVCLEPSVVRELLIGGESGKSRNFISGFHTLFNQKFLGDGLFSELNNTRWSAKRRLINPAFKRRYLKGLLYQYNNSVAELVTYLKPKADGKSEIMMADALNRVALDIIAKVAFGLNDLNVIADDSSPFCKAVKQSFAGVTYRLIHPFWQIDFRSKNRSKVNETREAIKLLRETARKCIAGRIEDINAGSEYPEDILMHLLKMSTKLVNTLEFGLEEMVDEFVTFFIAGQETTAQLMTFTFELVGRHQGVYKRLQEEIDRTLGKKKDITYEDVSKLEYMNMVLKEVLRYAPPVPAIERTNHKEFVINGHMIPAGSAIGLNHYALGRDPRFWDNPEEFNPERFRDEESSRRMYAYFPFAMGPRVCIGQHFAMMEAKVIIAKLLHTFSYQLVPGVELQYISETTLKPKNGTPIYLTIRSDE